MILIYCPPILLESLTLECQSSSSTTLGKSRCRLGSLCRLLHVWNPYQWPCMCPTLGRTSLPRKTTLTLQVLWLEVQSVLSLSYHFYYHIGFPLYFIYSLLLSTTAISLCQPLLLIVHLFPVVMFYQYLPARQVICSHCLF